MKKYKLANGNAISEEDIEHEAAEYEAGAWEGTLDNICLAQPAIDDTPSISITIELPESMVKSIDAKAGNRSDYIRRAVAAALRQD